MAVRGIIVAIERYPHSKSIAQTLAGTLKSAEAFRTWLLDKKGVAAENILFFADIKEHEGSGGTTRKDILRGIESVLNSWQGATEELYVFWSGHGFAWTYRSDRAPLDVLVCSDFETPGQSGDACVDLAELQERLALALGPGDHFWFIDACRNKLDVEAVDVARLTQKWNSSPLGASACRFTMFPVGVGEAARVASGYSLALVEGLGGHGRAKGWDSDNTVSVTFERLFQSLRRKLWDQTINRQISGACDGRILTLEAPARSRCLVSVEGARETDQYRLVIRSTDRGRPKRSFKFRGPSRHLAHLPGDYEIRLYSTAGEHRRIRPTDDLIELWDEANVVYSATELVPRSAVVVDVKPKHRSKAFATTIGRNFGRAAGRGPDAESADLRDTRASVRDEDLGLSLSRLGAGWLVNGADRIGLEPLPAEVSRPFVGAAEVRVLAALPQRLRFRARWLRVEGGEDLARPTAISGVWTASLGEGVGDHLLFWQIGEQQPRATVVRVERDAVTLVVIALVAEGDAPSLYQYALPRTEAGLVEFCPPGVALSRWMTFLWGVQRDAAARRWTPRHWNALEGDEALFLRWLENHASDPRTRHLHRHAQRRYERASGDPAAPDEDFSILRDDRLVAQDGRRRDVGFARLDVEIVWTTWVLTRSPKLPPVDRMARHESLAFVGATQRNLVTSLRQALDVRAKRPWRRIEVYLLASERLPWLVFEGTTDKALQDERHAAERQIRELLEQGGVAASWALYEYDRPTLFGSFWDWETASGWVHVSPHVWGEDIAMCPAVDYPAGTEEFDVYVRGLAALRRTAKRLATSDATDERALAPVMEKP